MDSRNVLVAKTGSYTKQTRELPIENQTEITERTTRQFKMWSLAKIWKWEWTRLYEDENAIGVFNWTLQIEDSSCRIVFFEWNSKTRASSTAIILNDNTSTKTADEDISHR